MTAVGWHSMRSLVDSVCPTRSPVQTAGRRFQTTAYHRRRNLDERCNSVVPHRPTTRTVVGEATVGLIWKGPYGVYSTRIETSHSWQSHFEIYCDPVHANAELEVAKMSGINAARGVGSGR